MPKFKTTTPILAPGPADLKFDDIGFGPLSGSIRIDDDLIGLSVPAIDIGFFVDYTIGARLVVEAGFGTPKLSIDYDTTEGQFTGKQGQSDFNNDQLWNIIKSYDGTYRNRAITYDTRGVEFLPDADSFVVAGSTTGAFLKIYLDYVFKLALANPFVGVDIFGFGGDYKINERFELINAADKHYFVDVEAGDPIFAVEGGVLDGTKLDVPTPPDYRNDATGAVIPYTVDGSVNEQLPSLHVEDRGPEFGVLEVDIDAFIFQLIGIPTRIDLGDFKASVDIVKAQAHAGLAVAQRESFRPEQIRVKLELLNDAGNPTGQVIEGRAGDKLAFDSSNIGFGKVRATYTLYGAVEQTTGLALNASLQLGLLAGEIHWTGFGPDVHFAFGPLIPLPSPEFDTGLIPIVTDSEAITPISWTTTYQIYSEKTVQGGEGNDPDLIANPGESSPIHGKGGDDVIRGYKSNDDKLYGDEGNDQIYSAVLLLPGEASTSPTANDQLFGGTGDDLIEAGAGHDHLDGDAGSDVIRGGAGDDTLLSFGTDGIDELDGGTGIDTAIINRGGTLTPFENAQGNAFSFGTVYNKTGTLPDGTIIKRTENFEIQLGFGDDSVFGGDGNDVLSGGQGDDFLDGAIGYDIVRGEGGNDDLRWQQPVALPRFANDPRDQVSGGMGLDTVVLQLSSGKDVAINMTGNVSYGRTGYYNDFSGAIDGVKLDPDSGNYVPLLIGEVDQFKATLPGVSSSYRGGPDNVVLKIRPDVEKIIYSNTSSGRDFVTGGWLEDSIFAYDGNDTLNGWMGRDIVDGGNGDDMIVSFDADELIEGGAGTDTLMLVRLGDADGVIFDLAQTQTPVGENYTIPDGTIVRGMERLYFDGNDQPDVITGAFLDDIVYGDEGNDRLDGRGGGDKLYGGDGDDVVTATEVFASGVNIYAGDAGENDTLILEWKSRTIASGGGASGPQSVARSLVLDLTGTSVLASGSTVSGFERGLIVGDEADDTITGGDGKIVESRLKLNANGKLVLVKNEIGDSIEGRGGDDTIVGNRGADILDGGAGDDRVTVRAGDADRADGGDGFDTVVIDLRGTFYSLAKFKTILENLDFTDADGNVVNVAVQNLTLPNGLRLSNFEAVEFITNPIVEAERYDGANLRLSGFDGKVVGTDKADYIQGSALNDALDGMGGNDRLSGGDGDDIITALVATPSPRPDLMGPIARIDGGRGGDIFSVNDRAIVNGQDGFDQATVALGHLTIGVDADLASRGARTIRTDDRVSLVSLGGIEQLEVTFGGGADKSSFRDGLVSVDFGAGTDAAVIYQQAEVAGKTYSFGVASFAGRPGTAAAPTAASGEVRTAALDPFTDRTGLSLTNFELLTLYAGSGDDIVDLTRGALTGSKIDAGAGADLVVATVGRDAIAGGLGDDSLYGQAGDDVIDGGEDNDAIEGNEGNDRLLGGAGLDVLDGGIGDDVLDGGPGGDRLIGGAGNDTYYVDAAGRGGDAVVEDLDAGRDTVISTVDLTLVDHIERLQLAGRARSGTGNDLDNTITGNAFGNVLTGGGGADLLQSLDGNDDLFGGDGDDTLIGGLGRDVALGGMGADRFLFRDGDLAIDPLLADRIGDFSGGREGDKIVVAPIDAAPLLRGDQAFAFIGTERFHGIVGELRYEIMGRDTLIEMDTTGDGVGDLFLKLTGAHTLLATDFQL